MPAAKFIPQRFQNFVLPQHRHAAKTYARLVNSSSLSLAVMPSKEQVLRKKRGPKKHGPVAKLLKARLKGNFFIIPEAVRPAWDGICALFYEDFEGVNPNYPLVYIGETEDHYWTIIAMAYAIALDEGV